MSALGLAAFASTPLQQKPYEHVVVPGFLRAEALDAVAGAFPAIAKPGLFPLSVLQSGPAFRALIAELDSPAFEAAVAEKFGLPIEGKPKLFTVRGRCHKRDGGIHTDSTTKIVTVLVYLNPGWEADGGRLRVLRSATDLGDCAAEIPPDAGILFAFRRSERSFHGHEPFDGERRALQLNWMTDLAARDREFTRHRLSSYVKRFSPFA
jgi:SM-20-related protein